MNPHLGKKLGLLMLHPITYNRLAGAGIKTIGDVIELNALDLAAIGCSDHEIEEIKLALSVRGLELRPYGGKNAE